MIGRKFNKLTVLKLLNYKRNGRFVYQCQCDCNKIVEITGTNLRLGRSRSCGCLQKEINIKRLIKHGKSYSKIYKIYSAMIQRCYNPKNEAWEYYGERGIKICKRWLGKKGFINFYQDMGDKPKGLSLDRINNNKGYSKNNCQWSTPLQQVLNRRKKKKCA